jgi:HEAT repeat protein
MSILRNSSSLQSRIGAAYVLTFLHDVRADRLLLKILRDKTEDYYLRSFAAEAISFESRQNDVVESLLETTRDKSAYLRYTAINCLDWFWELPNIDEPLKRRILATLRDCCKDTDGIRGYEHNNGQRARLVLKNYAKSGKSTRR